MSKRQPFKIDPNDPDLQTFEQYITNYHPELYVLKQNGQPSYEHPEFWKHTRQITSQPSEQRKPAGMFYLPGNTDPYDIYALNLFTQKDIDIYINDVLYVLGKPFVQQVETKNEQELIKQQVEAALNQKLFSVQGYSISVSDSIQHSAQEFTESWLSTLPHIVPTLNSGIPGFWLSAELIYELKKMCKEHIEIIDVWSHTNVFNNHIEYDLDRRAKFGYLATILLYSIKDYREQYLKNHVVEIPVTKGEKTILSGDYEVLPYPELMLSYELMKKLESIPNRQGQIIPIEQEGTIGQSPSTALLMWRRKTDHSNIRNCLRRLFIKAWLYSYLKNKNTSANNLACLMAEHDQFFLVGEKSSTEDTIGSRTKTLKNIFSAWRTQYKKQPEMGYETVQLKKHCKIGTFSCLEE